MDQLTFSLNTVSVTDRLTAVSLRHPQFIRRTDVTVKAIKVFLIGAELLDVLPVLLSKNWMWRSS